MSSHHIIRENQEPAVLIWKGFDCPAEAWLPLMEWSPLLLVHEKELAKIDQLQINIDGVIQISCSREEIEQKIVHPYSLKVHSARDANLSSALAIAQSINIQACHVLINANELEQAIKMYRKLSQPLVITLFHSLGRTVFLKDGTFKKWMLAHQKLQIHSDEVRIDGYFKKEDQLIQTEKDGILKITTSNEVLAITEYW